MVPTYWSHELDLTRSHDVIDHMTIQLAIIYYFLLVSHWNRASIFNRFQDICIHIYLDHDLDLSGHVTSSVKVVTPISLGPIISKFILTRIDYCNALFAGLPDSTLAPLQRVMLLLDLSEAFDRVTM